MPAVPYPRLTWPAGRRQRSGETAAAAVLAPVPARRAAGELEARPFRSARPRPPAELAIPAWWPPGEPVLEGPDRPGPAGAALVIAGAHGGSGCSTLAALLAPARDAGTVRPGQPFVPVVLRSGPVVVTARCTPAGAAHAAALAAALGAWGAWLLAVAVISDGLPEAADARYRYRLLDALVPVVRVPFTAALRVSADPAAVALPRRARAALAAIRLLEAQASDRAHRGRDKGD